MIDAEADLEPELVPRPDERSLRFRRRTWATNLIDRLLACGTDKAVRITPELFRQWRMRYGWDLKGRSPMFNHMAWGELRGRLVPRLRKLGFKLGHAWEAEQRWLDIWLVPLSTPLRTYPVYSDPMPVVNPGGSMELPCQ